MTVSFRSVTLGDLRESATFTSQVRQRRGGGDKPNDLWQRSDGLQAMDGGENCKNVNFLDFKFFGWFAYKVFEASGGWAQIFFSQTILLYSGFTVQPVS